MNENSTPQIGQASFLPALLPQMFWLSISGASWFFGNVFEPWQSIRDGLHAFSIAFGSLLFIVLIFDFVAQYDLQTVHLNRQAALIAQIRPPEPVKIISEPAIPFPPERFATWLWTQRQLTGAIPTVDECVKANYTRQLVQVWFAELVSAGAIIGREERGSSGDFAPGWTLERCATASRRANTITALPGQRVT